MSKKVIIAISASNWSKEQRERLSKYMKNYFPHYYRSDPDKPGKFKRIKPE